MIMCCLTFNSNFDVGDIIALISSVCTIVGGLILFIRFDYKLKNQEITLNKQQEKLNEQQETLNTQQKKLNEQQEKLNEQDKELNTQQKTLNEQQVTLNTQQKTLNEQQVTLNIQQKKLNEQQEELNGQVNKLNKQQLIINDLQINEQNKNNKADLFLSIKEAGLYDYDLIVDNRGESTATNVMIFSLNEPLLEGPDNRSVALQTPLEPHQVLQIKKIHSYNDVLDFTILWDDGFKVENTKEIQLKTDSLFEYETKLNNLYSKQAIPRRKKNEGTVPDLLNDLNEKLNKYGPK